MIRFRRALSILVLLVMAGGLLVGFAPYAAYLPEGTEDTGILTWLGWGLVLVGLGSFLGVAIWRVDAWLNSKENLRIGRWVLPLIVLILLAGGLLVSIESPDVGRMLWSPGEGRMLLQALAVGVVVAGPLAVAYFVYNMLKRKSEQEGEFTDD